MDPQIDEALRRSAMFRRLSPDDRQAVADASRLRTYLKGDRVFSEGDPADSFRLIVSGRVKVLRTTPTGKDVILEVFGAGDPFGAVAVYEGRPYPASAVALEEAVCLAVERSVFFGLLEQRPSLVRGLLVGLTQRLVELTNRLTELSGSRIESRLARLFLKLAQDIGRPGEGGVLVPMVLSRQDLADMTGTTIETCIRIMSRWHKQDILHTGKEGFVVLDRAALEESAGTVG